MCSRGRRRLFFPRSIFRDFASWYHTMQVFETFYYLLTIPYSDPSLQEIELSGYAFFIRGHFLVLYLACSDLQGVCHWTKFSTSSLSSSPPPQSSSFSVPASTPCDSIFVHLDWQFCVLSYSRYLLCTQFPYLSVVWVLILCIHCEHLLPRILILVPPK